MKRRVPTAFGSIATLTASAAAGAMTDVLAFGAAAAPLAISSAGAEEAVARGEHRGGVADRQERRHRAVARLREAGAIVFAQSTSSEYGHKGVTDSPLNGITRNPWNTDYTTCGSSACDSSTRRV